MIEEKLSPIKQAQYAIYKKWKEKSEAILQKVAKGELKLEHISIKDMFAEDNTTMLRNLRKEMKQMEEQDVFNKK